jgi:hypothetical protein
LIYRREIAMERLTYKQFDANAVDVLAVREINWSDENGGNKQSAYTGNAINLLSAYEDTGLTPEEVKDILSVMSENQDDVDEDGISTGMINDLLELAKYRQAEEQGLLVKISCEGCKYNSLYGYKEFETSKCKICSRFNYVEYKDEFEALKGGGAE